MRTLGFYGRYSEWVGIVTEWSIKHDISFKSAISILSDDSRYNHSGGPDLITRVDLYWNEFNEFVSYYHEEENESTN